MITSIYANHTLAIIVLVKLLKILPIDKEQAAMHLHCFNVILFPLFPHLFWFLVFCMLRFKPTFSLSSFTFIKRLFSSSLLSAIRVVSSQVIDISPSNLIPACASSSTAFLMMYSAYKLNKQGDNIQP